MRLVRWARPVGRGPLPPGTPTPADLVTAARAVLACAVAALVAVSFTGPAAVVPLVALASVALVLDAVDGRVARRTGTVTGFGARFDMEVDAFLIAVLSVAVARTAGWWVLAIGAARYAFLLAGLALPWLRGQAPPRPWCKVVAAVQGIVLVVAVSGLLPLAVSRVALAVALALLAESFGREAWELWRSRAGARERYDVLGPVLSGVAFASVWLALVLPDEPEELGPATLARIPAEALVVLGAVLVLRRRPRRAVAAGFGLLLGLLVLVKALDIGFYAVFERPFDLVNDWYYLGPALGVLADSRGRAGAVAAVVLAAVLVVAVLTVLPWSALRLARVAGRHRRTSARALVAVGTVWLLCALAGLQFAPAARVASASTSALAMDQVAHLRADIADRGRFARAIAVDRFRGVPGARLLRGLRGKDVLVVFVESYGRVALEDPVLAAEVTPVLDAGTRRLRAAGWSSRSAFLTSPTFGAASWLAHSTLQSGLWVDSQQRYDQLLTTDRLTLSRAFGRAGWRTVFDVPAITQPWPDGAAFYGFDTLYDAGDVGYRGPRFGYATMPDQYTLAALERRELTGPHRPVMAEVDLVSSHHPWTPLPHLVPWSRVGDGSVFDPMPAQGETAEEAFGDPGEVRRLYARSLAYTMRTLVSFLVHTRDRDLVLVVLGDHQPHTYVTGPGAGHDVPVTVVARDPAVLARVSGWDWQPGLHPSPRAPVWRMDSFRDRFLTAFAR